jgi:hypothetical protein
LTLKVIPLVLLLLLLFFGPGITVEEEDEEGEGEEQRKEKSTLFFIFSPLSSSCFSSIYSISVHCFLLCCLPSAREKENNFFFSFVVALWVGVAQAQSLAGLILELALQGDIEK